MSIIGLLVFIALVGLVAWLLIRLIPMPAEIQKIIVVVAVVIALLIVLDAFGLLGSIQNVQVPRIH